VASNEAHMSYRIPEGWQSITARIVVDDIAGLAAFLQRVFGATGDLRTDRPSVLRIGDSNVMLSTTGPRETQPAFLYVYVEDIDATYQRAMDAGATSIESPWDTPYGDRRGMIEDPYTNIWQIATFKE
jgi:PhnB protein